MAQAVGNRPPAESERFWVEIQPVAMLQQALEAFSMQSLFLVNTLFIALQEKAPASQKAAEDSNPFAPGKSLMFSMPVLLARRSKRLTSACGVSLRAGASLRPSSTKL